MNHYWKRAPTPKTERFGGISRLTKWKGFQKQINIRKQSRRLVLQSLGLRPKEALGANADQAVAFLILGENLLRGREGGAWSGGGNYKSGHFFFSAAFPPLPLAARKEERKRRGKKKKNTWLADAVRCRRRCLSQQCKIRSLNAAIQCLKAEHPAQRADISLCARAASNIHMYL